MLFGQLNRSNKVNSEISNIKVYILNLVQRNILVGSQPIQI